MLFQIVSTVSHSLKVTPIICSPALLRCNWQNCIIKCTEWFDIHIHREMITTMRLINTSIPSHSYSYFTCVWWESLKSILSKFQVHNTSPPPQWSGSQLYGTSPPSTDSSTSTTFSEVWVSAPWGHSSKLLSPCYGLHIWASLPQVHYVEPLIPSVMVFGDRAFRSNKDLSLIHSFSLWPSFFLLPLSRIQQEFFRLQARKQVLTRHWTCHNLILDFPASKLRETNVYHLKSLGGSVG